MPELVGFQTMVILDPNGMTFDAVAVFGLAFQLLFKSGSSYCVWGIFGQTISTHFGGESLVHVFHYSTIICTKN
jgi:hypothetical protein